MTPLVAYADLHDDPLAGALLALSVLLTACAAAPTTPVASREHAALLAARGEHGAAAAEYEAAAALSPAVRDRGYKKIVAVVSGGNIDLSRFAALVGACPGSGDSRAL